MNGDGGLLAVCLASRGWLALRRGDLSAAEGDAQTALAATELPAPPMYRALNGGVLVKARDPALEGRERDAVQVFSQGSGRAHPSPPEQPGAQLPEL